MSLGDIRWSPDYKTQHDMSLPSGPWADILPLTAEEQRLVEEFRKLRPGQLMEVVRDAQGRFWRTALDDVTDDPA